MISSLIIAFAMYTKIPMPRVDWTEEKMKYAICFFPLIGVVIGALVYGGFYFADWLSLGIIAKTVLLIVIPVAITGGIHLDGFLDTIDARSSYKSKEEKLQILKDPHAGAFAIIGCSIYFLLMFGIWSEVTNDILLICVISFVYSRALSGFAIVTFKGARTNGLLASFSSMAKKRAVQVSMCFYIVLCMALMLLIQPIIGGLCILSGGLIFGYYRYISYKEFGGITGDLAGYFLQLCELIIVIVAVLAEKICL